MLCISGSVKPKAAEEKVERDEDRGEKRKRDQGNTEETQVEEKYQEAKKVCKGFQLSAHTVLLPDDVCCWDVHGLLCRCRSFQADGVCCGETWRERRDAGRTRDASRHECHESALTSVSVPNTSSAFSTGFSNVVCVMLRCVCVFCRSRLAYFAVFDGHGGARASQFAAENLHHTLASKFPKGTGATSHFRCVSEPVPIMHYDLQVMLRTWRSW